MIKRNRRSIKDSRLSTCTKVLAFQPMRKFGFCPGRGFTQRTSRFPSGAVTAPQGPLARSWAQQPHITASMCHPQPGRTAAESSAITEQAAVTSATSACISSAVDIEGSGSSSARCFVLTAEL